MQTSECIILKNLDFRDHDRIITFLTQDSGIKSGVLYRAKSLRSPMLAQSELFNHVQVIYSESPAREMVKIKKCELIDSCSHIRLEYRRFLYASYFAELISCCIIPPEDSHIFFDLLSDTLKLLQSTQSYQLLKLIFEQQLMHILGVLPNLSLCTHCRRRLWDEKGLRLIRMGKYQFDINQGGLRCCDCIISMKMGVVTISVGTLMYWKQGLLNDNFNKMENSNIKITGKNMNELNDVFQGYLKYHLGRKIKSYDLLKTDLI